MRTLGAQALSTTELIATILGSGGTGGSALQCAHAVLESAGGSLGRLAATPVAALTRVNGVGQARATAVHAALEGLAKEKALGLGKVAQPLRVAVSGGTVSPPIDVTLALLGQARTLARLDRALAS